MAMNDWVLMLILYGLLTMGFLIGILVGTVLGQGSVWKFLRRKKRYRSDTWTYTASHAPEIPIVMDFTSLVELDAALRVFLMNMQLTPNSAKNYQNSIRIVIRLRNDLNRQMNDDGMHRVTGG
jgi:hypothetical protein